jgi:hypothetical protein
MQKYDSLRLYIQSVQLSAINHQRSADRLVMKADG